MVRSSYPFSVPLPASPWLRMRVAEAPMSGVCKNTHAGGLIVARAPARDSSLRAEAKRRAALPDNALKE